MISSRWKGIPQKLWLPNKLWLEVVKRIPIPCIDLIPERQDSSVLFGYRVIPPYRKKWALVGGRMLFGENLVESVRRISREYQIRTNMNGLYLVGVFPVSFTTRSDVSIAIAIQGARGKPRIDGKEFEKLMWAKNPPVGLAGNYKRMIAKWLILRKESSLLRHLKIE